MTSDAPYAKYHQLGTKKMPARPFVPALGPPGQEQLTEKAAQFVKSAIDAELKKIAAGR